MSSMEGPYSILRMIHRQFGLFFTMFPLFLANFSGIYLVSWQAGEPGEGNGAAPQHSGMAPWCLVLAVLQDAVRKKSPTGNGIKKTTLHKTHSPCAWHRGTCVYVCLWVLQRENAHFTLPSPTGIEVPEGTSQ